MIDLAPGDIVWVKPDFAVGREQSGWRPVLIVAGTDYLAIADTMAIVVPLTSVDRDWPNHVLVAADALRRDSWAMAEQVRAISRERITSRIGRVPDETLMSVRTWLRDFLEL